MGVVGALVTSVGASALALRGGGGRRGAFEALPDFRRRGDRLFRPHRGR